MPINPIYTNKNKFLLLYIFYGDLGILYEVMYHNLFVKN